MAKLELFMKAIVLEKPEQFVTADIEKSKTYRNKDRNKARDPIPMAVKLRHRVGRSGSGSVR